MNQILRLEYICAFTSWVKCGSEGKSDEVTCISSKLDKWNYFMAWLEWMKVVNFEHMLLLVLNKFQE